MAFHLFTLLAAASAAPAVVEIDVEGLHSARGVVQICVTRSPAHFPDCSKDPAALKQSVPASKPHCRFSGLTPGRYAITLFHDENANHRLDKAFGIPREGFGFSRNPVIRFGPPKFDKVGIEIAPGVTRTAVRVQYLL